MKLTRMACCMKSIAMSRPNNSPATRVNRLIMEHAPRMASKKSSRAVHTHTLITSKTRKGFNIILNSVSTIVYHLIMQHVQNKSYHPVHARNSFCPKSFRSFAKLNMNVYIKTVGSATPSMSKGCPPIIEWMTPHKAVDARV